MKALKTKWLKSSLSHMEKPYGISHSCYVDLACSDDTALWRVLLVMKWLGWKPEDVSITYTDPPATSITSAPLPPPATPTLSKSIVLKVSPVIVAPTPPKPKPIPPKPVPPKPVPPTTSLGEEVGMYSLADLQDPKDLFGKRAVRITVEGCDYDVLSWRRCFNVFLKHCFDYHQHELTRFNWSHKWPHEVWPLVKRIYPGPTRYEIVPTNEKDSKRLVTAMEMIRRGCNIPPSCVRITCAMKVQKDSPLPPAPLPSPTPIVSHSENYANTLSELLEAGFANGVRIGSIIDRTKIRKAYAQRFGKDLPENFDLDAVLPKIGVVHDGKVFPRPSSKDGGWRTVIARLVGQGNIVFQFSRLMELHASEFMQAGIVSPEMLRETVVREAQSDYEISGELFAPKGEMSAFGLLRSIVLPSDGVLVDVNAVAKRVPCVDVAFIRNFCKSLNDLVRVNQDLYVLAARIEFDDVEVARGKADCEAAIKDEGFFSLSQLRLEDSVTMNDQGVSDGVLRRVFFLRFLSDRFDAHGQIVCAKGTTIDGQIPLRAFLRAHSEVSLEQLASVAKEYKIAPWLALKTANEEMMRIDGDRFVAPALISFDVPSIDNTISSVCEDCITPFGDFANLSDFPAVPGFPWNEFLLESFLRRSSMRFRLVSPSVAAKEAVSGAVVPCNLCEWSAENAFADIALRRGVAAETEDVGDFLVATRCVLKRSAKTVGAVVDRMKKLGRH